LTVQAAARPWVVRHELGMTPAESDEFGLWLKADPVHENAWDEAYIVWHQMDRLTINRAVMAESPTLSPI
jgi:ferric-dicitrate binding protein FerR (iron transport regulator)